MVFRCRVAIAFPLFCSVLVGVSSCGLPVQVVQSGPVKLLHVKHEVQAFNTETEYSKALR